MPGSRASVETSNNVNVSVRYPDGADSTKRLSAAQKLLKSKHLGGPAEEPGNRPRGQVSSRRPKNRSFSHHPPSLVSETRFKGIHDGPPERQIPDPRISSSETAGVAEEQDAVGEGGVAVGSGADVGHAAGAVAADGDRVAEIPHAAAAGEL